MASEDSTGLEVHMGIFKYKQAEFHYWVYGHGPNTVLAFHGYGQTKDAYFGISKALGANFKVISFDLFFHGGSSWNAGDSPIQREFLSEALESFLAQLTIHRFSLMGFSMG
ncbi:MAG: alpha/beta hydrolase, partial [Cytophagales bacterium]|nr:alpha/beta hydrolase [Cytophagales bacterium]